MKKILLLVMAAVFTFGLAACDPETKEQVEFCVENPTDPSCQPDQLLADQIVSDWDGSMEHIELAMENLDFSEAMTQTMEFTLLANDGYGGTVDMHYTTVDSYVFGEYTLMKRFVTQSMEVEGQQIDITTEVIYEEVATGVHVYVNIGSIKSLLSAQGAQEVVDGMEALGLTGNWVVFKFDDSLENIIEIEVLKDMMEDIFFKEMGVNFFYDLQDEVELELNFNFELYGLNLGLFVDHIVNDDFAAAELLLENIDFEGMVTAFDLEVLGPKLADELLLNQADIELALPAVVVADEVLFLQTNGFFAWFEQLTMEEEEYYITEVFGPEAYDVYYHHQMGDLDHFIIMTFLNDYDVEMGLRELPGFDFDLFKANMDSLDYDAFYMEMIDIELLFQAIYDGQAAFDSYLATLQSTAPETVKVLEPFSGTVGLFEDVVALIEDIELGFENLTMFSEYFGMEYYVQNNMATIDVEVTEDSEVKTTVEFSNYGELAVDVIEDVYWYLDGFNSFEMPYVSPMNCPIGESCEMLPLGEIQAMLNNLGPITLDITYDPVNTDKMMFNLDFSQVLDEFMQQMGEVNPIQTLEMTMTMEDTAVIEVPSSAVVANDVAADFAKFSLYFVAWDAMADLEDDLMYYGTQFVDVEGVNTFNELGYNLSLAFDSDLSTITVGGTASNPTFEINLVWIDGTNVFTSAITKAELDPVIGDGSGAPDATEYQMYLGKVDADNFNLTKLFLVYLLEDDNYEDDYYYEEYPEEY